MDKGVQLGNYATDVLYALTGQHQEWAAEKMLEHGMPVGSDDYAALYVYVNNQAANIAKLLLDKGTDLDRYQAWAEKQGRNGGYKEIMAESTGYQPELQSRPKQDGLSMSGITL